MNETIESSFEQLQEMIKDIRFAMFVTHAEGGQLHAWPMTTQQAKMSSEHEVHEHDKLWFFMARSSKVVNNLVANPHVNISYAEPRTDTYVSVSGMASVVESMNQKERFWNTLVEAWYEEGITDPDVALVCVQIESAEYWSVREGKLAQAGKMLKATLMGERLTEIGEHGKITPATKPGR
ncbi:pyridoxamine 5'-phosphate oxidase [Providencia rettgeri]|nr:pyridoxamine 5'-phosphate oxidase [Providencia rettgeri]